MPRHGLVRRLGKHYDCAMIDFAKHPEISDYSQSISAPVVCADDYARLRQYPWSEELADELDRAIVVPMEQLPSDVVTMRARFIYADQLTGTLREIELAYPDEADPAQGKISVLTPVGSAMIGLRAGQEIAWEFPDGSTRRLRVVSVTQPAK